MKEIKVAVVGFGSIAKTHALAIYASNLRMNLPFKLKLSHIVTSSPELIKIDGVKACASIEDIKDQVSIIDICNINKAHIETIGKAVKMNVPIYCEKPIGSTAIEAKEAHAMVDKAKILNGVGLVFRYIPAVHLLKRAIAEKKLGDIIAFEARYFHNGYLLEEKRENWKSKKESGGGASLDLGIHMIDIIRVLFGGVKEINNEKKIYFPKVEVDEYTYTSFKMKSGINGTLLSSRVFTSKSQHPELRVYCEKGSMNLFFENPYCLELINFDGTISTVKVNDKYEFTKYCTKEGSGFDYHTEIHMASICDFAKKVYDGSHSGFGADFKDAYIDQMLVEGNLYLS